MAVKHVVDAVGAVTGAIAGKSKLKHAMNEFKGQRHWTFTVGINTRF